MRSTLFLLLALSICACQSTTDEYYDNQRLIAEVYDSKLYENDIENLIPTQATQSDSTNISQAYLEQWIRESLILHEAKKDVPPDMDRLIEDYRESLLKLHFENKIIEQRLDSVIDTLALQAYYDNNKTQYLLKEKAIQLFLLKCEVGANFLDNLNEFWRDRAYKDMKIIALVNQNNVVFSEDDWYKLSELSNMTSRNIANRIRNNEGKRFTTEQDGYKYFIKVGEIKDKNEIPPLPVIDDQISRVILHQRKKKILEDYIEELYDLEIRKKSIKIHSK